MPPEKVARYQELKERLRRQEIEKARNQDVFALLGYEPNCKPRHEARDRGDPILPPPCGECPQELFHSATEFDLLFGGSSGGGKTKALTVEALRTCVRYPGSGSARSGGRTPN